MSTLIDKVKESGFSDTSADDWFFKSDVFKAVTELKKRTDNVTNIKIDEIFGDLSKTLEEVLEEIYGDENE